MKKFSFSLERILTLRQQAEDERRRALGEVERRIYAERSQLESLEGQRQSEQQAIREVGSGGSLNVRRVIDGRAYQAGLQVRIARSLEALRSLAVERQNRMNEYIEARKRRRVLEKLRQRKYRQWREETEREERMELDEVAGVGHRRRHGGS